jgi:hypothetical protein
MVLVRLSTKLQIDTIKANGKQGIRPIVRVASISILLCREGYKLCIMHNY